MDATPFQQVFPIFSEMGRAFLQTKFFSVGSSLGLLSMKKIFQIGPTVLALKLDKGSVLGGGGIEQKLTYILTMKMTFNLNKF